MFLRLGVSPALLVIRETVPLVTVIMPSSQTNDRLWVMTAYGFIPLLNGSFGCPNAPTCHVYSSSALIQSQ